MEVFHNWNSLEGLRTADSTSEIISETQSVFETAFPVANVVFQFDNPRLREAPAERDGGPLQSIAEDVRMEAREKRTALPVTASGEACPQDTDPAGMVVALGIHGLAYCRFSSQESVDSTDIHWAEVLASYVGQRLDSVVDQRFDRDELAYFRRWVDSAPAAFFVVDPDTAEIQAVNRTACDYLGYDREELLDLTVFDVNPTIDQAGFAELSAELQCSGRESFESVHQRNDGSTFPVELDLRSVKLEQWYTVIIARDISEHKANTRDLELFETLVDHSMDGFAVIDPETAGFRRLNERVCEMLGYDREELMEMCITDVCPDFSMGRWKSFVSEATSNGSVTLETVHERRDGSQFPVEIKSNLVRINDDDYLISSCRDISDRREYERKAAFAQDQYETLLAAAPDPIFVLDRNSREIVELNKSAVTFLGQAARALQGRDIASIHPPDETRSYDQLWTERLCSGDRIREFDDQSPLLAETASGDLAPVEISTAPVTIEDTDYVQAIVRDVSTEYEYQSCLERIQESTTAMFAAEDAEELMDLVTDTLVSELALEGAICYLIDDDTGVLNPVTCSHEGDGVDLADSIRPVHPGEGFCWDVYASGESTVLRDRDESSSGTRPQGPFAGVIAVPCGRHGVIICGRRSAGAFEDHVIELVEIIAATSTVALDRIEYANEIEEWSAQLEAQKHDLERLEDLNAKIRDIGWTVVNADTRAEVEREVTETIVDTDAVSFAWLGTIDPIGNELVPASFHGPDTGYLETLDLDLDLAAPENAEPAVRAATSKQPVYVQNAAANIASQDWKVEAVGRDFHSILSIPLLYEETIKGVLTLYSKDKDGFPDRLQSVLEELGALISHGFVTLERKQAVLSNRATELEFDIDDPQCVFLRWGQTAESHIELEGVIPRSSGNTLVLVRVGGSSIDRMVNVFEDSPMVEGLRLLEEDTPALVEIEFSEPFIGMILAEHGISLQSIVSNESECRVTVRIPPSQDANEAVKTVSSIYDDVSLLRKREDIQADGPHRSLEDEFLDRLTPRQREVIQTAYLRGYFDSPKQVNGDELAEIFDFSRSAFHHHVRESERKLFETIFGE